MSLRDTRAATELPSGEAVTAVADGRALLVAKRESGGRMTFPDHASYIRYQRARAQVQLRQQFRTARAVAPTPSTVPEPPTALIGTSAPTSVTVSFTPGLNGGSVITGYKYSTDGATFSAPASQTVTSVTITGLTTGTTYSIQLKATNAVGDSTASDTLLITPLPGSGLRLFLDAANIDPSGNTWPDAGGQQKDAILTGISGKPTWSSANGGVLTFTSGSTNQYAYLPAGFADFTSGITIMAFVDFGSANSWERIIDFGNGTANNNILLARVGTSNELRFDNYSGGSASLSATLAGGVINNGWGFYAIRLDGTNYKILNQDTDSSGETVALPTNVIRTNNYIGRSNWDGDAYFAGKMGIIAIYNTALSDSDITAFYDLYKTRYFSVPGAPTSVVATAGNTEATVSFTAPSNTGGLPITSYTVTSNPGNITATGSSSPITVTGLTNDIPYTFTVIATNAIGDSSPSTASGAVTPSSVIIEEFKNIGSTMWIAPENVTEVEYLVVGGGGGSGGGYDTGGGGGGGGGSVKSGTYTINPGASYNIIVGSGGLGGTVNRLIPSETNGLSGSNSEFDTIIALGGGGGFSSRIKVDSLGGLAAQENSSSFGGSGGGSAGDGNGAGGGGGGSSGDGFPGVSNNGGNGGTGIISSITGTTIIYGAGGRGANGNSNYDASQGVANTGQGARGGGGTSGSQRQGANGGSGIVILKYTLS